MTDVTVIGLPQSNFVWAVRIALAEKAVEHELIPAPPHSDAVSAYHPLGKIPVMRHGDNALVESRAIIDYIDRTFGGVPLVPTAPELLQQSDIWTSIVTTSIEPLLVRQYVFAYMFPESSDGSPDRERISALLPKLESVLDMLEAAFQDDMLGKEFGRIDAFLVPILFYFANTPEGGEMLSRRERLSAYLTASLARDSVRSTMPPPPDNA